MRSIRVYLFALVAICLILATTAFGLVVAQTNAVNRQRAEAQARETAKALLFAVDGKIGRAMGVLRALSVSNAAATHNWRGWISRRALRSRTATRGSSSTTAADASS